MERLSVIRKNFLTFITIKYQKFVMEILNVFPTI